MMLLTRPKDDSNRFMMVSHWRSIDLFPCIP